MEIEAILRSTLPFQSIMLSVLGEVGYGQLSMKRMTRNQLYFVPDLLTVRPLLRQRIVVFHLFVEYRISKSI
jgi:hypothetical protein